jgi:hypothetical protein
VIAYDFSKLQKISLNNFYAITRYAKKSVGAALGRDSQLISYPKRDWSPKEISFVSEKARRN